MLLKVRSALLFAATLLIGLAAWVNATVVVPHLREDMVEIDVRPTLLGAIVLALNLGSFALVAFATLVLAAGIQSVRSAKIARLPLLIIGAFFLVFGGMAFVKTGSHHVLGYVLMGILVAAAGAIPQRN
jgi:hypothetical protein